MSIPRMWMSALTCGMNVNWKLVFQCELSEVVSQNQHQHLFAMFGWGNSLGAFCTLSWVLYSLNGSWFCRQHQLRWFQNNICTFAKNKICLSVCLWCLMQWQVTKKTVHISFAQTKQMHMKQPASRHNWGALHKSCNLIVHDRSKDTQDFLPWWL